MQVDHETDDPKAVLARAMVEAIRDNELDDAEAMLGELSEVTSPSAELLTFDVVIAIQRGRVIEALQHLNSLDDECCPELKVLCLYLLGDSTWHGMAMALEDSEDPAVATAMRQLLGKAT